MALSFRPVERGEVPEVAAFLASSFGVSTGAPFIEPHLLEWKYFQPRDGWCGPRSYVLEQDGAFAAHGCAHPVTFLTRDGDVTSTRVIDWAASPQSPGAGVLLFRKFSGLVHTLLAVGGSPETQSILPKIGFRRVSELALYARPVRPLRQYVSRPVRNWKSAARLFRNMRWAHTPLAASPAGICAMRVRRFDCIPVPEASEEFTAARRSPELLNYMLACPGAVFSGFVIREGAETRGYFVLSRVGHQTRIADMWIDSGDWRSAVALAVKEAARDPLTYEVAAVASIPSLAQAMEASGFQRRGADPIFLYDPEGRLATAPPLYLQLLDGDECHLNDPSYPYWT